MKKMKHMLLILLAISALNSCQTETENLELEENLVTETTNNFDNTSRHLYDYVFFSIWHQRYVISAGTCITATNYHCIVAVDDGIFEFPGDPLPSVGPGSDIVLNEGTYTSPIRASFEDGLMVMEILAYSDQSMYNENEWKYTIPENCQLKIGDSYNVGETIESVYLMAGEYEIVPSTDGESVGTVTINAEVNYF